MITDKDLIHKKLELGKETAQFLFYTMTRCLADGIAFHLYPSHQILMGVDKVSGFFDDEEPNGLALHAALGSPDGIHVGLGIAVHEFNHSRQYLEKDPCYWIDGDIKKCMDLYEKWDRWLTKEQEYPPEEVDEFITACMRIEADCESRALKMIKEFNLPIDTIKYAKQANAYILFYRVMQKERKWCNKKAPSRVDAILELMPDEIVTDLRTLPEGFYELVVEHCMEEEKRDDIPTGPESVWLHPVPTRGSWRFW